MVVELASLPATEDTQEQSQLEAGSTWQELAQPHHHGYPLIGSTVLEPLETLRFESVAELDQIGLHFYKAWPTEQYSALLDMLNSEAFIRLGGVGQMQIAYTTLGKSHINSRLFHTLLVAEKAYEACLGVNRNAERYGPPLQQLSPEDIKVAIIAGLVHDIPHGPFSHLFEKIYSSFGRDEQFDHDSRHRAVVEGDPDFSSGMLAALSGDRERYKEVFAVLERSKNHPLHFLVKKLSDRLAYLAADSFSNIASREELHSLRKEEWRALRAEAQQTGQQELSPGQRALEQTDERLLSSTSPKELSLLLDDIEDVIDSLALVSYGGSPVIAVGDGQALHRIFAHREKTFAGNCISAEAQLVVSVLGRAIKQAVKNQLIDSDNSQPLFAEHLAKMSDSQFLNTLRTRVDPTLRLGEWFAEGRYLDEYFLKQVTYYFNDPEFEGISDLLTNSHFRKALRMHLQQEYGCSPDQIYVTYPFDDDRMELRYHSLKKEDDGDWTIDIDDFNYVINDRYKEFTVWISNEALYSFGGRYEDVQGVIRNFIASYTQAELP